MGTLRARLGPLVGRRGLGRSLGGLAAKSPTRARADLGNSAAGRGPKGFAVRPRRWVVERTLAWLVKRRRLARNYEQRPDHSEGFTYLAMISLMLRRLTKSQERV